MVLTTITLTSTAPIYLTSILPPLPPLPAPSPWPSINNPSFTTIITSAHTTITATPGQTLSVYPQPPSPASPEVPSTWLPAGSTTPGTVTEVEGIIVVVDNGRVVTTTVGEGEPWTTISYTATWLPSIFAAATTSSTAPFTTTGGITTTATPSFGPNPTLTDLTTETGTSTVYTTTTTPLPLFTYVLPTSITTPSSPSDNGSGWSSWSSGHRAGAIVGVVLGFLLLLLLLLICCLRMVNGGGKVWAAPNWNGWGHRGAVGPVVGVPPGVGTVGFVGHPGWGRYGY